MSSVQAKLVTIITVFEARDIVLEALAALGVRGFSLSRVEGVGVHGKKRTGLVDADNVEFAIVTSEPLCARILEWVDGDLLACHPGIAYSSDVVAVAAKVIE